MKKSFRYQVVAAVSSLTDADVDSRGWQILAQSNCFRTARRECIEWAAYDDILVRVVKQAQVEFSCDGYLEATERYPRTCDAV